MNDCVEDGPNRRISRNRRRSCNKTNLDNDSVKSFDKNKEKGMPATKVSPEKLSEWFSNSFNSKRDRRVNLSSSPDRNNQCVPISSTPKELKGSKSVDETDALDTSDALFADLDLENIQSQIVPKSAIIPGNNNDTSKGKDMTFNQVKTGKIITENGLNFKGTTCLTLSHSKEKNSLNSTNITQSPYLQSKFHNYKPTQSEELKTQDKTVRQIRISDKADKVTDESVFSFSFVGNDTVYDERDDTVVFDSPVKPTKHTRKVPNMLNSTIVSLAGLTSDKYKHVAGNFETSTQVANDARLKSDRQFYCTPYKHKSDETLVDSQLDTSLMTQASEADITQLKDKSVVVRYRCTPYKNQRSVPSTQYNTQTESLTQCSVLEITSVISKHNSQYQKGQSDWTDTQGKYLEEQSQYAGIQPTPICDMTGLIVESQSEVKGQTGSQCDIFDESYQDPVLITQLTKIDEELSQRTISQASNAERSQTNTGDLTSYTQSLVVEDKHLRNKRSFEDDVDDIFNASQKRRNLGKKKDISSSKTNKIHLQNNVLIRENDNCKQNSYNISSHTKPVTLISNNANAIDEVRVECETKMTKKDKSVVCVSDMAIVYDSKNKGGKSDGLLSKDATPNIVSLQDRIRERLKHNAGQRTPEGPRSIVDQLREHVLERAQMEAEMVKETVRNDVGPFYGLPTKVKNLFAQYRGITSLYDWQDECLKLPAVLNRKNLIYSLPTSGGKTLVAEILILQELLCQKRNALLILPFVSIVQEKVRNMSQFAIDLSFHVEEYAGSKGRFPPTKRHKNRSLYIATIEKAHSIINSLIEDDRLDSLGLVVVDELHMIGEGGSRGATMESTLIKLLHASGPTQIIGMSATLSNIEDLQKFLNAEVYSNNFRPVKLTENLKVLENIYRIDQTAKCTEDRFIHERIVCFQYRPEMEKKDPNHLLGLVLEVIPDNSCLIFCPTKKNCESVAKMLCEMLVKMKSNLSSVKRTERKLLLKELYNDSDGKMCPVLQYTLHFGVAYHHSGLTMDERKLIEEAYSTGVLCLLTCTSTLAAGVNLPAKRVIVKSPYVGRSFISQTQYKQMVGRAGRAGIDTTGESILICQQNEREKVCELLDKPLEKCHSSLLYNGCKGIRNFLLSAVGLKIATTTDDVFKLISRSLAAHQQTVLNVDLNQLVKESLQKLIDVGLVKQIKSQSEDPEVKDVVHSLEVTDLGKATFKGPVDPDYACMLYEELMKDECLVISTHLHLLYLVTPYDLVEDIVPSWTIYHNQMNTLSAGELKVASIIGAPESYIIMKASLQRPRKKVNEFVVKRFYLTLMLYELWCHKTVWEVAEKFQVHRGYIQSLLNSAASFASCVSHFCQELPEFWAYQDLMGNFVKRLSYCVTAELIPLMEIPGVKLGRARLMYNAGFQTLSSVATSHVEQLVQNIQFMPRNAARQIIASAKLLLNEKAEAMIEEVEELVAIPTSIIKENQTAKNIPTPLSKTPGYSQDSMESGS